MSEQDQLMPPQPVAPPNVVEVGMPDRSDSVTVEGALIDYIPVAIYCGCTDSCSGKLTSIGDDIIGIMAPDGTVHQPKWSFSGDSGELLYILMVDPDSEYGVGTTVEQILYWQRISQSWVPANAPHTTSVAVTSGISESDTESLSFSVGANIQFGASTSKMNADLSSSLTKSFSSTVTISESTTVTETFSFEATPAQQVVAVYQLVQDFQISPGPNLLQVLEAMQQMYAARCSGQAPGPCQTIEAVMPVTYPEATYLQTSGVDTTGSAAPKLLSPAEIRRFAEMVVTGG